MVGAVGETASMKRRKLWKTGEGGLCCSSSAIQTRLDPSSLLEERSETPIVFVCFFCVVGYPPNWGKRPRYIDIDRILIILNALAINALLLSFLRGKYWNFTLFQNSRLLSDLNVYAS